MTYKKNDSQWVVSDKFKNADQIRLFCFPYAGGGASIYRLWTKLLPVNVGIYPIQLPGRENRIAETPVSNMRVLVDLLSNELIPYMDRPFVLFGHSIGARIAFELARVLRRKWGISPCSLIVSGSRAPHIPEPHPLHHLPDDEFMSELRRFSGTPEAVLQSRELMEMFIPILRADFSIDETYVYSEDAPLDCPVFVFGGTEDIEAKVVELEAWADHTSGDFTLEMIRGDHFFLQAERDLLLRSVSQILLKSLAETAKPFQQAVSSA